MPALDSSLDDATPENLVDVGFYASAEEGSEHGLVILALGHSYWLMPTAGGFRLYVDLSAARSVRLQLDAFDRESRSWPPKPIIDSDSGRNVDVVTPLVWSSVVLMLYHVHPRWVEAGSLNAEAIFANGEVWRCFTALFLHASAEHVISNALSGILVFTALVSTLGRLRGWLLAALAGAVGNLGSALLHFPAEYRSLGASTAIFSGVGLLTGRAVLVGWRSKHPHRWRALFVPLAAGLTVLGLYGAGGVRVDVGAHLTGFGAGVVVGLALGAPRRQAGRVIRDPRS